MIKKLNDKLYLSLQLYNGPEGSSNRVFVMLRNQNHQMIGSQIELTHRGDGFFSEEDVLMPNVDALFAFFKVTEADGVTISCDHTYVAQRYDRDFTGEQINNFRPIAATIIGEVDNKNIVAEIADIDSIVGEVEDDDLIGLTSDSDIIEQIQDENITGSVQ